MSDDIGRRRPVCERGLTLLSQKADMHIITLQTVTAELTR